jgi:hypothetical protein
MTRTSRARHRLHVVEFNPTQHTLQKPSPAEEVSAEEPSPPATGSDEQSGLDAAATGMTMMLRVALKFMKSYGDVSPSRRNRGR